MRAGAEGDRMRDPKLVALVILIAVLNVGHTIDHIARGDVQWPLTIDAVPFIAVSAIIYALLGFGLYLYWTGRVGPASWRLPPALVRPSAGSVTSARSPTSRRNTFCMPTGR